MKLLQYLALPVLIYCGIATAASPLVNKNAQGVAIDGYDTVAYFVSKQATPGTATNSTRWQDATWFFSSAKNRDTFVSNPEQYAPQFGGYCAYAASLGQLANGDPRAWTIVDDKLYLNFSIGVRDTWRLSAKEFIGDANILWPDIVANHQP